jgi:hypothetical protein
VPTHVTQSAARANIIEAYFWAFRNPRHVARAKSLISGDEKDDGRRLETIRFCRAGGSVMRC